MYIYKNKTIRKIQSLAPDEFELFVKYILKQSKHIDLLKTARLLKKYYPDFQLDKGALYELLYPNNSYQDYRYRNLLYRLDKLLQDFLSESKTANEVLPHLVYIKNLKNTHDQSSYRRKINELQQKEDLHPTEKYFLAFQQLEDLNTTTDRQTDQQLQSVHYALDQYFLNEKLKLVCLSINDAIINQRPYQLGIFKYLSQDLEQLIEDKKSMTYLLYLCYLFQSSDNEIYFATTIRTLQEINKVDSEELRLIFTMCINFCIRQINKGQVPFFTHLFHIYKLQLSSSVLYSKEGYISSVTLKNLVTVSLRLKEYKWTENLIASHYEKLPLLYREENYHYLLARLFYTKKMYKKALYYLLLSEPQDFLNNLSARVLQIKCYYESDDYHQLDNALQNFTIYLLRHKNKSYHYRYHVHFIKYLQSIVKCIHQKKLRVALAEKIRQEKELAEKHWLLEIIESIR